MPSAHALVVGLKYVDSQKYNGWDGRNGCTGCELDVDNMSNMLWARRIKPYQLKTQLATSGNVKFCLQEYAKNLQSGDLLVFYFSGHGGQATDTNGDESDGKDETLVLYNRHLIDDELNAIWPTFKPGVKIVMISDSCNSGTNYRLARDVPAEEASPVVAMTRDAANNMQATMIHMGGCRDGATSTGFSEGGEFTTKLLRAWQQFGPNITYEQLFQTTYSAISTGQKPAFNCYGPGSEQFAKTLAFDGPWIAANRDLDDDAPAASTTDTDDDEECGEDRVKFRLEITGANPARLGTRVKAEAGALLAEALKEAKSNFGIGKVSKRDLFGDGTYATAIAKVSRAD